MQTLTLNKEDFKEETHWIALCDFLEVPNTADSVTLGVFETKYTELH